MGVNLGGGFGALYAYGGADHALRWCARPQSCFGFVLAEVVDLDGDRVSDLVARDGAAIVLLSGASGQRLGTIGNRYLSWDDGLDTLELEEGPCVVVGAYGHVSCYSIGSNRLTWEYEDPVDAQLRVPCVRSLPDIDGDGVREVAAGFEPSWDDLDPRREVLREVVVCLSGATGKKIFGVRAHLADRLGHSIAGCGDWNGDGIGDFVAGAPAMVISGDSLVPGEGHAFVISGRDGEILSWLFSRGPTAGFGYSCAELPSLSPRILISAYECPGEDALYSCSAIERQPRRLHAGGWFSDFGNLIKVCGDQDGDGVEDYAVSTVYSELDCDWPGMVTVFSGADDCQLFALRRTD